MRNPIGFAKRYRSSSQPGPSQPNKSPITDGYILKDDEWKSYVDRKGARLNYELNRLIDIHRENGISLAIEDERTNQELALDVAACAKEILVKYISLHQEPGSQAQLITKRIADFAFLLATKTVLVDHPFIWIRRTNPDRPIYHDGSYSKWEAEVMTHTDWKPCHQVMRRLELLPAQSSQGEPNGKRTPLMNENEKEDGSKKLKL